jgi:hypothetical protein
MKPKKNRQGLLDMNEQHWTPQAIGLDPTRYDAALRYLFDRPVPQRKEPEWFWDIDEPDFEATPLEWTRIQTVLFANAGHDLASYDDDQVGMGLNYVMSNGLSDVPFAAADPSVPLAEAMRMMAAMPALWRDCIGPRVAHVKAPIGWGTGRLGFVCYMWFDVWPTFRLKADVPEWRDAVTQVFRAMLAVPCREVQIAALHGVGHSIDDAWAKPMQELVDDFLRRIDPADEELKNYALAARTGCVQ